MKTKIAGLLLLLTLASASHGAAPAKKAQPLPDLVVGKLTAVQHKTKKKTVVVNYQIKNLGAPTAAKTTLKLQVINGEGKVVATKTVGEIDPGSVGGTETFTLNKTGNYTVRATADYNNLLRETDESNNDRFVQFSIGVKL